MTAINTVNPKYRSSWYTPAQCKDYYKVPYQFREIQIHWWNDPSAKPTHDGIVNYIANKTGGSVNYVASAGKITKMVPEENCALTTQGGNPYGIKIECSPYGTDGDYQTIAELIADIRKRRGNLPLVPHKKYWNTACPGTLDLARMDRMAKAMLNVNQGGTMVADRAYLDRVYQKVLERNRGAGEGEDVYLNKDAGWVFLDVSNSREAQIVAQNQAAKDSTIASLQQQLNELSLRPTKAELEAALGKLTLEASKVAELERRLAEEQAKLPVNEATAVKGFVGRILDFLLERFKQ